MGLVLVRWRLICLVEFVKVRTCRNAEAGAVLINEWETVTRSVFITTKA